MSKGGNDKWRNRPDERTATARFTVGTGNEPPKQETRPVQDEPAVEIPAAVQKPAVPESKPVQPVYESRSTEPKLRKEAAANGGSGKTYKITEVVNTALELCSNAEGKTRSTIAHEALERYIGADYFENAKGYLVLKACFERGDDPDTLPEINIKPIVKKTLKKGTMKGKTVVSCLMTSDLDDEALDLYSKDNGMPRGAVMNQALSEYLTDYLAKAEAWLAKKARYGIF